jgi:hypothetical protein
VSVRPGAAAILRLMLDTNLISAMDYLGDFPDPSTTIGYA